jgi:hypothetical protein
MTAAHAHLLLSHGPIMGSIFGFGVMGFGLWRGSDELKRTALLFFVIAAVLVAPLYLTGEPATDAVKGLPGVSDHVLDRHQAAAGAALAATVILGGGGVAGLIIFRGARPIATWFAVLMLGGALLVSGLIAWTANLGGQVRHSEIRVPEVPGE